MSDSPKVQVVALKQCFIDGQLRKIGDIFSVEKAQADAAQSRYDEKVKAGVKTARLSIKSVSDPAAAKAEAAKVVEEASERQKAGALASSGGKAARQKVEKGRELTA